MDKKRILIVDDEPGFTNLLKLNLEETGKYFVETENNGKRALQKARDFKPDLVFLDVVMPEIDGGDVAAQLRDEPGLADIPIVFLTAIVAESETGSRSSFGGFPFLAKPVTMQTLTDCIEQQVIHTNPNRFR